ncbi:10349_t:CDS:2, partial [Gigaspora rosea]
MTSQTEKKLIQQKKASAATTPKPMPISQFDPNFKRNTREND